MSAVTTTQPSLTVALREQLAARLPSLLPPGMSPERFLAVTLQAITRSPGLAECQPASVLTAVLEAAQLGLEPTGSVGGAWIVPFREKGGVKVARMILDYRGILQLLRDAGAGEIKAVLVYEGDEFSVEEGTTPRIIHRPAYRTRDPNKITHVYAWSLKEPAKFEVMTRSEIDQIRARSRAANEGPWVTDYGQMARKTVIKRLAQYLPLKPSARGLLETDSAREAGAPEPLAMPSWRELAASAGPPQLPELPDLPAEAEEPIVSAPEAEAETEATGALTKEEFLRLVGRHAISRETIIAAAAKIAPTAARLSDLSDEERYAVWRQIAPADD